MPSPASCLGRRDRLVDGDAAGDDGHVVAVAHDARAADRARPRPARVRTSVLPRSVRMNEIPGWSAIAATSCAVWLASDGCSTVEPWIARNDAMSSSAICDGPSSPIETPACEPERRRFAREIAAMRMKSYARERNAAKVEANGTQPRTCMPTAAATICCSAMNISK